MGERMHTQTIIGSDREKPARPERYQLVIGLASKTEMRWMSEATGSRRNEYRFKSAEPGSYHVTVRDSGAYLIFFDEAAANRLVIR
jgi:hypothetical protein